MTTKVPSYRHRGALGRRLLLAGVACSLGCVNAEAQLPQVCFLESGVSIEVLPLPNVPGVQSLQGRLGATPLPSVRFKTSFVRDGLDAITEQIDEVGAEASVHLNFVEVVAVDGLDSFSSIRRIELRASPIDPESSLGEIVLAACDHGAGCDTSSPTVTLSGSPETDLIPYLREPALEFTLELEGSPPLEAWTLDVDVCLSAQGSYQYRL